MSDNFIESMPMTSASFEPSALSAQMWSAPESFSSCSFSDSSSCVAAPLELTSAPAATFGDASKSMTADKSIAQLVTDGAMVKTDKPGSEAKPLEAGQQPSIKVTWEADKPADFVVKADGKVEVNGDPEASGKPRSEYRVFVEPGADQKTTDELVTYLAGRIRQQDSNASPTLSSDEGLVSDGVKSLFQPPRPDASPDSNPNPEPSPDEEIPEDFGPDSNPGPGPDCNPGPGPDCNPDTNVNPDENIEPNVEPNDTTPPNTPPQTHTPWDAMRESMKTSPYENLNANSLGAYDTNYYGWFSSFLTDEMLEELGNPPDMKKLAKVMAKFKNDPKFRQKMESRMANLKEQGDTASADKIGGMFDRLGNDSAFAEQFGGFMSGQQEKRNATSEEMAKFFDPRMQDAVASSQVADAAKMLGVNVKSMTETQSGDLALAVLLGHAPTAAEKQTYANYANTITESFRRLKQKG